MRLLMVLLVVGLLFSCSTKPTVQDFGIGVELETPVGDFIYSKDKEEKDAEKN